MYTMLMSVTLEPLHIMQNVLLVLLSVILLPFDTYVLVCTFILQIITSLYHYGRPRKRHLSSSFRPRRLLVSGVGTSKGLLLARAFYEAGHTVIGADFEPYGIPVCGKVSRALQNYYKLCDLNSDGNATQYTARLVQIIRQEHIELWISCSEVASAIDDSYAKEAIERQTKCIAVQFDTSTTALLQEKSSFAARLQAIGLPAPDTYNVTSRIAIHKVLDYAPKKQKQYIIKPISPRESARSDMTLLPQRTLSLTYSHISRISISPSRPWLLQEFVDGEQFSSHALVVRGEVAAFVAHPSTELTMHCEALAVRSALSRSMLKFTREFVSRGLGKSTGHLSFEFLVRDESTEQGPRQLLYPIKCNTRAQTAFILLSGTRRCTVNAYLRLLEPVDVDHSTSCHVQDTSTPDNPFKFYWLGDDLFHLALLPLFRLLSLRQGPKEFLLGLQQFATHVFFWKDGTYEAWDPLPWWWLYHVYWPGVFLATIWHRKYWSRVNVSTGKIFRCKRLDE